MSQAKKNGINVVEDVLHFLEYVFVGTVRCAACEEVLRLMHAVRTFR